MKTNNPRASADRMPRAGGLAPPSRKSRASSPDPPGAAPLKIKPPINAQTPSIRAPAPSQDPARPPQRQKDNQSPIRAIPAMQCSTRCIMRAPDLLRLKPPSIECKGSGKEPSAGESISTNKIERAEEIARRSNRVFRSQRWTSRTGDRRDRLNGQDRQRKPRSGAFELNNRDHASSAV
jgi:hypothetical protein